MCPRHSRNLRPTLSCREFFQPSMKQMKGRGNCFNIYGVLDVPPHPVPLVCPPASFAPASTTSPSSTPVPYSPCHLVPVPSLFCMAILHAPVFCVRSTIC